MDSPFDNNPSKPDKNTAFLHAVSSGDIEVSRILLDEGADVNFPRENGMTPIFAAVFMEKEEMVRFLKEQGADVTVRTINNETLLHLAVHLKSKKPLKMVKLLVSLGVPVNEKTRENFTVLDFIDTIVTTGEVFGLSQEILGEFRKTAEYLESQEGKRGREL